MQIEEIDVRMLRPMDGNPRKISDAGRQRLRDSIVRFGLFRPLLVWRDGDSDVVIAGCQRQAVLRSMADAGELPLEVELESGDRLTVGFEVPCIRFSGSRAEARTVALRDNNPDGDWDWEALGGYLLEVEESHASLLELAGFGAGVAEDLAKLAAQPVPEFGFPDPKAEGAGAKAKPGMQIIVGPMRGRIDEELYQRLVVRLNTIAAEIKTEDISPILARLLDDSEGL